MKLLIVTQKVDARDPILGFFHGWIREFAKHAEEVRVVCLEEGSHDLPKNVSVYSLGKERGYSKLRMLLGFYIYIWRERRAYDAVFVHMNPEYVVLAGDLWRLLGKKVSLWYVHRQVTFKLRLAEMMADVVFTSSPESFRIRSSKVRYMGHGIDIHKFPVVEADLSGPIDIVHLGRITKIKNIDIILRASKILIDKGITVRSVRLVGAPVMPIDKAYKRSLEKLAEDLGLSPLVIWDASNDDLEAFTASSISVNAAPDGGMDKAVLGSLAAGHPTFASNAAFRAVFGQYAPVFMYSDGDPESLAERVTAFLASPEREKMGRSLSERVHKEYSAAALVEKMSESLAASI